MQLIEKIYVNYWYTSHFHHGLVHWGIPIAGRSFLAPTSLLHDPLIFSVVHLHGMFCFLASSRPCVTRSYGCVSDLAILWKLIKCLWFVNILTRFLIHSYLQLSLSECVFFASFNRVYLSQIDSVSYSGGVIKWCLVLLLFVIFLVFCSSNWTMSFSEVPHVLRAENCICVLYDKSSFRAHDLNGKWEERGGSGRG